MHKRMAVQCETIIPRHYRVCVCVGGGGGGGWGGGVGEEVYKMDIFSY